MKKHYRLTGFCLVKLIIGRTISTVFIGYLYNGNKAKLLNMMLSKTSVYVKSYDRQTK